MNPAVTAIIPTQDRAEWLKEAISSVRRQTCPPKDIVVVDDASRDATPETLASLAGPDLTVLRFDSPRGPAAARNAGAKAGRGRWLAFLDSDDAWLAEKLERQVADAETRGSRFSYTDFHAVSADGRALFKDCLRRDSPFRRAFPIMERRGFTLPYPRTSTVMIQAELFREIGGFDERYKRLHDDTDLWLRLHRRLGGEIRWLPESLTRYRVHDGQISRVLSELRNRPRRARGPVEGEVLLDDLLFWERNLPAAAS